MQTGPHNPIPFSEAAAIVTAQADSILAGLKFEPQFCAVTEALGRVLAEPVTADRDQPPFDRATRDGFAVQAADIARGVPLRIVGQIRAGESWPESKPRLRSGETAEIMTGAPLPPGADAVLMVEHAKEFCAATTDNLTQQQIMPLPGHTLRAGDNFVAKGSESRRGDTVMAAGTRLLPEEIALGVACGCANIPVIRQPAVAILPTGDELHPVTEKNNGPLAAHQIYDSNSIALAALVQQAGGIPLRQPIARDEKAALRKSIRQALQAAPLLLITGGVSMGLYDLVEEGLASLGAMFFFTGVKMQPGKPVVFGQIPPTAERPARYFFGLPGNPISAMVTFRVFVQPLLAALAGERNWQPRILLAELKVPLACAAGLTRFLPGILDTISAMPSIMPIQHHGSGDLTAHARANAYIIVPENRAGIAAGETVRVLLR